MPNQCQRPCSSHLLNHFKASTPARNALTNPSKLTLNEDINAVPELRCSAWIRRIVSRATTGGVRITASAKLKSSARVFSTPASIAVEIVAPERENPRKGRHSPCTAPIRPARWKSKAATGEVPDPDFAN